MSPKQTSGMIFGAVIFATLVFGFWRFVLPELKNRAYQSFSQSYETAADPTSGALIDEQKPPTDRPFGSGLDSPNEWDDPSCGFIRTDHGLSAKDLLAEFFRRLLEQEDSSVAEFLICPSKDPAPDSGDIVRKLTLLSLDEDNQTAELEYSLFGSSDGVKVDYRNDSVRDTMKLITTPWGLRLENSFPLGGHLYGVEQHLTYLKTKQHLSEEESQMLQHFQGIRLELMGF